MDTNTTEIENLMGNLKEDYKKLAVEPIQSFSQDETIQIDATDDRMNYLFVKPEDIKNKVFYKKEYTDIEQLDYGIVVEKKEDTDAHTVGMGELDKVVPTSFFGVKTVEEGADYYLRKNPDLPEGVADILARYTFGSKTEVNKEETKKTKKKKKPDKLEVKHGKFMVDFS